jgi:uncharacterized protein (DUF1697 family)
MRKYLALLRGINVGGNNLVDMKKLKAAFEAAGFNDVSTYINSGNVIFASRENVPGKIAVAVRSLIKNEFHLEIPVLVRDEKEMKKLAKAIPTDWRNDSDQRTEVMFLWEEYDTKGSLGLIEQKKGIDEIMYVKGALVWHIDRKDVFKSGLRKFIGTKLYKNITARNVNTVRKLAELMA